MPLSLARLDLADEKCGSDKANVEEGMLSRQLGMRRIFRAFKNEMFYNRSWQDVSIEQFVDVLNSYIQWYNEKRIKMSLGAMSPIDYRKSIDIAA